jgi:predicted helicase
VKAIRYATDRIGESGIVCFVNNNSFVTENSFDGMRKSLGSEFDLIYILDLGGNVRKNPKLSGTTHNVFGIQVGVSINLFVKLPDKDDTKRQAEIYYHAVGGEWRKEQKYQFLEEAGSTARIKWKKLSPDKRGNWITNNTDEEFGTFLPIGSKEAKAKGGTDLAIFKTYSLGVSTNRDGVVYDFDAERLATHVEQFAEDYNAEVHRWQKKGRPKDLDAFLQTDKVKWSRDLKLKLTRGREFAFDKLFIRGALYRPFVAMKLYCAELAVDRVGPGNSFLPTKESSQENRLICLTGPGSEKPFMALAANRLPDLHLAAFGSGTQAFPLYTYSEDGKERHDNITPKALALFQTFYNDTGVTREAIFHYIYALLNHPTYRARYAENLKRDLPRIPFLGIAAAKGSAPVSFFSLAAVEASQSVTKLGHNPKASAKLFHVFAGAGKKLADLHVNYESCKEFPLKRKENYGVKLDWRVETMKLAKDKRTLFYNDFLTLSGIPAETYDYRLGNRSALEWVIDQYRVTHDEDGNIVRDPNRPEDEQYIVQLVGKVIEVSVETIKIINHLPFIGTA